MNKLNTLLFLLLSLGFIFNNSVYFSQCPADAGPDTSICLGSTAVIGTPAIVGLTYSWSPTTNLSCSNCAQPIVTALTAQTYTLTVTGPMMCSNTNSMNVTIDPVPAANFTFTGNNSCGNNPIQFTNTSSGTGLNFSWNFGNPASGSSNTSNVSSPSHEFIAVGTGSQIFTVTLVVTNAQGCASQSTQIITIRRTPGPSITDPIANLKNCDGSNFNMNLLNTTTAPGNSNYTIQWGDGSPNYNAATFPAAGIPHTYTGAAIFTMYFIVTGSNGCIDSTVYNVANITNPAIGAANPGGTTGCGPLTLCFPLNNYQSNHPTTYYVVDFGDNSPFDTLPHPPPSQVCHTYSQTSCGRPGNAYTFKIKAINLCDSSSASINPIRVYTGPQANFTVGINPACVNTSVPFINSTITGFNASCLATSVYSWNFGDGGTLITPSLTSPTHVYTAPGTYTVVLSVTNSCGTTTQTRTVCIEIPPIPNFTISPNTNCAPFVGTVTNLATVANTCNVTYNYQVIFQGSPCTPASGNFAFVGGTSASSPQPQISFQSSGNFIVRQTVTNSCGSFTFDRPVVAQAPPQLTVNPISAICAGTNVTPTANINSCLESVDMYSWSFPSGSPANSSLVTPGTISYTNAGSFTISLAVTNACGTSTATRPLVVNPIPPLLNPNISASVCVGQTANFTSNTVGGVTYTWSGPNFFSSNLQNPSILSATSANAGTYTVFGSFGSCVGPSSTVNLSLNPNPVITVNPPLSSICIGNSVSLTASGGTTYSWSPTLGLSSTTGATVSANPIVTTNYTVVGTVGSCSSTAIVPITVNPLPIVNAGLDISLCDQPISSTFVGTPIGGTWSGPNITSAGIFTPSGTGVFNVNYSFTNAFGCTNTDIKTVTVIAATPANAGIDRFICIDAPNLTLLGTPSGGSWTGSGVSSTGIFDPTIAGIFALTYTFGSGSCATSDLMDILVNPLPIVNAGLDFTNCLNAGTTALTGTPLGGTWSGTGVSIAGIFNPSTSGAGIFTLTYSFTDPITNCTSSDQLIATINALPIVNAGIDQTLCNQPIAVSLIGTPIGGSWSGGTITAGGNFTPSTNGVFDFTYTFTNTNGCTNSDIQQVTVVSPTLANAGTDVNICVDAPDQTFSATPVGGTWSGSGVTPSGIFDPTIAGTFTLTYSFGTGTCATTDTKDVTVNPLPIVNAGLDFTRCIDAPNVTLTGSPMGGSWAGTGISNATGIFSPTAAGSGTVTLTYTFTDANGCLNSDQLIAIINALPLINVGIDTLLCNQAFPINFSATPNGGIWSGPNVTPTGIFTANGIGNSTLTYTFTNSNGCINSDSRIISVVAPIASNAGSDLAVCIDAPNVTLTGTPAFPAGIWSGTDVSPAGIFNPTTAGTFNLTISNGAGNCLTSDVMQLTVNPLPIVNAGTDIAFCPSDSPINFSASPIGGTWSGTGITSTTLGTFNPAIPAVGNYIITYTFTNPITGCINSDSKVATIHPFPLANFTYNPIACLNNSEIFTNTSILGSTYDWEFGDGSNSTATSPSHAFTTAGNFNVELVVTSIFGCLDSITQTIEIRIPPTVDFTLTPDSSCAPVIVSFTNNSSGPVITYNWNFGNGQTSTLQNPGTQTYFQGVLADTSYTIQLSVTNFCGTVSDQATVIAMPKPTSIFGTNVNVGCSPLILQITNNSLGLPDTYFWDFGDGTTATTASAQFSHLYTTGANDTTFTIMLAVANECGVDTSYYPITVLPNQVTAFFNTDAPSGCVPHTVNFTQFSTGASFYNWNFGDGNVSTTLSPSHTFTTAGTFTVNLFVNDGCGFDTINTVITVFPSPIVAFNSQPDSVCINDDFTFQNQSIGLASSAWTFGDGGTSNLFNPSHIYASSGTYNVTLTGISLTNGCASSVSHPVVVSTNPVAIFAPSPISGCIPLNVNFTNTSSNTDFQIWTFGDGDFATNFSPNHVYTSAGTFVTQLYVENSNGCADSSEVVITAYPLPIADFNLTTSNECFQPLIANFTNASSGANSYNWTFGDGQTATNTNPSHTFTTTGNFTTTLTASTIYGCIATHIETIESYQNPTANFSLPTDTACAGQNLIFQSSSLFADSVQWNFGNGNLLWGTEVGYEYPNSGSYPVTIIAYGAGGCSDTITITTPIVVNPSPTADFTYENIQAPDPLSGIVEFINNSSGANAYVWEFGNGNTSTETNPIERYNQFADFDVLLIAENEYGCLDTSAQTVSVDFFYGLFIPNAFHPGDLNFEVANFIPKGVGMQSFELLIYDDWGNLIWQTNALDSDGRPTEYWDGMYKNEPVQQDAYVWKATATFLNGKTWEGKKYEKIKKLKRSGTVTVIR